MSRTIVTTHYRYKRPPRKRKAVALEVPAIVVAAKGRRRGKEAAAPVANRFLPPRKAGGEQDSMVAELPRDQPVTTVEKVAPAIVTIRRKGRFGHARDLTAEKLQRRADAAEARFREIVRSARQR